MLWKVRETLWEEPTRERCSGRGGEILQQKPAETEVLGHSLGGADRGKVLWEGERDSQEEPAETEVLGQVREILQQKLE